jgi:hypothetical protein
MTSGSPVVNASTQRSQVTRFREGFTSPLGT